MPLPAAALLPLLLAAAAAASPAPPPPRGGAWTFPLPGDVSLTARWVPPGEFPMGSPGDEFGRREDEGPRHAVTLTRGCWMGDREVTQQLNHRNSHTHHAGFDAAAGFLGRQ